MTLAGLCQAELEVFREVLGEMLAVERTEHVVSDGRRRVYRVVPTRPARVG